MGLSFYELMLNSIVIHYVLLEQEITEDIINLRNTQLRGNFSCDNEITKK